MTLEGKKELRAAARKVRDGLAPLDGTALAGHLLAWLRPSMPRVIGGYWPLSSEMDPRAALAALRREGVVVALAEATPRHQPLVFRRWEEAEPLLRGRFGTLHASGAPIVPDMLLVPLLAFDRRGYRLGYGGGYYDRTLAALPGVRAIGCAYAGQEIDALPVEPHDMRLHAIATERGVIEPER